MLETARQWLADLRAGADPRRFAYQEVEDPDDPGSRRCAAAEARAELLLALQHDHRPEDAALLRLLLDAEIAAHARAPLQGLDEELHLAAWLVARLRDPADVYRMWAAKTANFDTHCGLDGEHLVAAGVDRTLAHLRAHEHPQRDEILEYLDDGAGGCIFDEAQISGWHAARAEYFPAREADESPLTLLERALRFAPAEAPRWLETWLAGQERSASTLRDLCHYALRMGDLDRAVATAQELVDGDGGDGVDSRERLARVLVAAGRLEDAEAALAQAADCAASSSRSAFQQRHSLEAWLALAEAATTTGPAVGRRALARADALLTAGFGHCLDNLDRLVACAAALGEADTYPHLVAACDEERRRTDALMARLTAPA